MHPHNVHPENTFHIRRLQTRAEREAAFRLRYEVFVLENGDRIEQLGLPADQVESIHSTRLYEDFTDSVASLFGVITPNGELVGTVRSQLISAGLSATDQNLLDQAGATIDDPFHMTINSRLAFRSSHRKTQLPLKLIGHVYCVGLEMGIVRDYIFVETRYEQLYLQLGYTRVSEQPVVDPTVGPLRALTLDFTADTKFRRIAMRFAY